MRNVEVLRNHERAWFYVIKINQRVQIIIDIEEFATKQLFFVI